MIAFTLRSANILIRSLRTVAVAAGEETPALADIRGKFRFETQTFQNGD